MPRFIGERVVVEGGALDLRAFVWRGERHEVARMLVSGRDVDLASPWWRRRHRAVVVVETIDGRIFKLRRSGPVGSRQGEWRLFEELDPGDRNAPPEA